MQGDPRVIALLDASVNAELQAIAQYTLHGYLLENLGYNDLAEQWRKLIGEERAHLELFMARAVLLGGQPGMAQDPIQAGSDIAQIVSADKRGEETAIQKYTAASKICHEVGDYVTRNVFDQALADEQEHLNFHETILSLISDIGIQLFAQRAIGDLKLKG